MAKKQKYYVVWKGHAPGVYASWEECRRQTQGFPQARYKSFDSAAEAQKAFREGPGGYLNAPSIKRGASGASSKPGTEVVWDSISVDAACSGNPGVMEYQGVDTRSKSRLFYQKFPEGTNNIGEFLAIVHALAMTKQQNLSTPIYSDSQTAMGWVRKKRCKTQLEHNARTERLFEVIRRAEAWLENNTWSNPLLKWETEHWGEIPADFGRK